MNVVRCSRRRPRGAGVDRSRWWNLWDRGIQGERFCPLACGSGVNDHRHEELLPKGVAKDTGNLARRPVAHRRSSSDRKTPRMSAASTFLRKVRLRALRRRFAQDGGRCRHVTPTRHTGTEPGLPGRRPLPCLLSAGLPKVIRTHGRRSVGRRCDIAGGAGVEDGSLITSARMTARSARPRCPEHLKQPRSRMEWIRFYSPRLFVAGKHDGTVRVPRRSRVCGSHRLGHRIEGAASRGATHQIEPSSVAVYAGLLSFFPFDVEVFNVWCLSFPVLFFGPALRNVVRASPTPRARRCRRSRRTEAGARPSSPTRATKAALQPGLGCGRCVVPSRPLEACLAQADAVRAVPESRRPAIVRYAECGA